MRVAPPRRAVRPPVFPESAPVIGCRLARLAVFAVLALAASVAAGCGGPEIPTSPVYVPSPQPLPPPPAGSTPRPAADAAPASQPPTAEASESGTGDDFALPDGIFPAYDGPLPEAQPPRAAQAKADATPAAGAELTVANSRGDLIMLSIPPGAVKRNVTVRIAALDGPPANPFAKNAFPGVRLEPEGLRFARPARLRIDFAKPLANPQTTWIFHVRSRDAARPIGAQIRNAFSLEGTIRHFSNYTGAEPTVEEASSQSGQSGPDAGQGAADSLGDLASDTASTAEMLDRLGDGQGAQDLIDEGGAEAERMVGDGLESGADFGSAADMLDLADRMQRLGWDAAADMLLEEAAERIREEARDFLDRDPPAYLCGDYILKLLEMGRATTLTGDAVLPERFRARAQEILEGCPLRGTLAIEAESLPPYSYMDFGAPVPFGRPAGGGEIAGGNRSLFRLRSSQLLPEMRLTAKLDSDNAVDGNIEVTPEFVVKLHLRLEMRSGNGWLKLLVKSDTRWYLVLDAAFTGSLVSMTVLPPEMGQIVLTEPIGDETERVDLAFPVQQTATVVRIHQFEEVRIRQKFILTLDVFPGSL